MTTAVFVDSSVLAYALGGRHPLQGSCRELLAAASGAVELHASVEAIQEVAFHRMRTAGRRGLQEVRQTQEACVLHPFDLAILDHALALSETGSVRGRDAVHAASALQAGFGHIVAADSDFDGISGLTRVPPDDWARLLR